MNDFILNIVRFNEGIDFTILIPLIFLYILAFWFMVSIWVYSDAKHRLTSRRKAFALAFLNQFFGVPFLLLYILARPFAPEELRSEEEGISTRGGVNVPIVNFTGKGGVVMSLELKINSEQFATQGNSEMTIDVNFDPKDVDKKVVASIEPATDHTVITKTSPANFAGKIGAWFKRLKTKPKDDQATIVNIISEQKTEPEPAESKTSNNIHLKGNKKKGKKKRK
jgi:hypothetical protein